MVPSLLRCPSTDPPRHRALLALPTQEDIAFKKKQLEDKKALKAAKAGVVAGKPLKLKKK